MFVPARHTCAAYGRSTRDGGDRQNVVQSIGAGRRGASPRGVSPRITPVSHACKPGGTALAPKRRMRLTTITQLSFAAGAFVTVFGVAADARADHLDACGGLFLEVDAAV